MSTLALSIVAVAIGALSMAVSGLTIYYSWKAAQYRHVYMAQRTGQYVMSNRPLSRKQMKEIRERFQAAMATEKPSILRHETEPEATR